MDVKATPAIRMTCAILVLVPAVCGMVFHFTIIAALYKGWENFRSNSFYLIIIQIIGCSIYLLFIYLYVIFPVTFTGVQYMGESFIFYQLPLFLDGVAYAAMLYFTFVLTINRLLIFVFPRINSLLFSVKNTIIISGVVWIYTLTTTTVNKFLGCTKRFSKDEFYIWFDCVDQIRRGYHFDDVLQYQYYVLATLMCFIYLAIYVKIKTPQQNVNQRAFRREIAFLIQTIPISVLFSIEVVMFKIIPIIGITGYPRFFVVTFENLVMIANSMSSPVLLFIFNRDVRIQAINVCRNDITSTIRVAPSNLNHGGPL